MSEVNGNQDPGLRKSELLPSQIAVRDLCSDMIATQDPEPNLSSISFTSFMDPAHVEQRLRASSLSELVLADGADFSTDQPDKELLDVDLRAKDNNLIYSVVRAWGWEDDSIVIDDSDKKGWIHQLDIGLWYSSGLDKARHTLAAYTSYSRAGVLPEVSREVYSPSYAESDYDGHKFLTRKAKSNEEILGFVALAQEMFDARLKA